MSKKLDFLTSSSSEIEVVSNSEICSKCAWFMCVRIAQGEDEAKKGVLMQNNQSSFYFTRVVCSLLKKGSKYARAGYFFTFDKIYKKEMKIVNYLTENMVADLSNKSAQCSLFEFQGSTILVIRSEDFGMHKI